MIRRDPIFKGCTRPALLWGVPIVPMVVCLGAITMLALWFSILIFVVFIPAYVAMRLVVRSDDQQFRLLWLKAKCRLVNFNRNATFWRSSAYSPLGLTKRK